MDDGHRIGSHFARARLMMVGICILAHPIFQLRIRELGLARDDFGLNRILIERSRPRRRRGSEDRRSKLAMGLVLDLSVAP